MTGIKRENVGEFMLQIMGSLITTLGLDPCYLRNSEQKGIGPSHLRSENLGLPNVGRLEVQWAGGAGEEAQVRQFGQEDAGTQN